MKKLWIGLAAIILICVAEFYFLNVQKQPEVARQSEPVKQEEKKQVPPPTVDGLLRLVNEERAKAGVAPLAIDTRLNQSAQIKADDMATNNYFDHVDKNGKHGYQYASDAAHNCISVSENIYKSINPDWHTAFTAVATWMSSPLHREAILNSKYDVTGFGVSGPDVVEHFCDLP